MSTYLYTRADASGKILHQGIFKTYQAIPPRLSKLEDGNVIVIGGLEENPHAPRERLSDGQKKADGGLEKKPDAPVDSPVSTPMP
jgi:hypothetical protein